MGYSELSIPVDIPWKRLGVSKDMIDPRFGDLRFPAKWDTSIAVFYHEVTESDPAYCRRKITYLKIVCTITNYQLGGKDVTVLQELRKRFNRTGRSRDFEIAATRSYPCHGALLQVGVFPNPGDGVPLHDFPYIASAQPRKRELYEVATQSGEVSSQSANKLNVLKGGTSTATTEDYDLETGGGSGGHSGLFGLWSEQHSGENKQVGTIQRRQTQDQNVATTDASRDRRESYSFSTSVNQLNTLLQTFHIGTNRAMFFMQPTPHMQDAKFSFVQGLRRIEGVQEFFLTVSRPDHIKGLCVEIALETAHDYVRRSYMPRLIPLNDLFTGGNLAKTEDALGAAVTNMSSIHWWRSVRDAWNYLWPHERWAANHDSWAPSSDAEGLAAEIPAKLPGIGAQDVALIFEEYEASSGYFFLAGRRFCACWTPNETTGEEPDGEDQCEISSAANLSSCDAFPGGITYGESYNGPIWRGENVSRYYNQQNRSLNDALSSSLLSRQRDAYSTRSFFSTPFMVEELVNLIRESGEAIAFERPVREIKGLPGEVRDKLRGLKKDLSLRSFMQFSAEELAHELQTGDVEAHKVLSGVMLAALMTIDPTKLPRPTAGRHGQETRQAREERFAASARGSAYPEDARRQRETPTRAAPPAGAPPQPAQPSQPAEPAPPPPPSAG